ncbi:MAG: NAD(P)/FAD-dependent oxidoreductase [Cyclobacteriaceae bacterium]
MRNTQHKIIIIGAGPAGLAIAGRLKNAGINSHILEQSSTIGSSWTNHYDRLHLHTIKEYSHLPHLPLPEAWPQYISKDELIDHMNSYSTYFDLSVNFNQKVVEIMAEGDEWKITTASREHFIAERVIVSTGFNRVPVIPEWSGQETFKGSVIHSRDYRNAKSYHGKKVLIIGMGNTGAEIALDLAEQDVFPSISIRGPVNIVPRDFHGRPTQKTAMMLRKLPIWLGDKVGVLLRKIAVGDLSRWGIETPTDPPTAQLRKYGKTPVIDLGTVDKIKNGEIRVVGDIKSFTQDGVVLTSGEEENFDDIILATGYKANLPEFVKIDEVHFDHRGAPTSAWLGQYPGLYFIGFNTSFSGILNAIYEESALVFSEIKKNFA